MKTLGLALGAALLLFTTPAGAQSVPWSNLGGWDTGAEFDAGRFLGCGTAHPGGPGFLGIARFASGAWFMMLGTVPLAGDLRVGFEVDGRALPERGGTGDGPTAKIPLADADLRALMAGAELRVVIQGHADGRWLLTGAAAALAEVDSCVAAQGQRR